jgi:hypothetical protein
MTNYLNDYQKALAEGDIKSVVKEINSLLTLNDSYYQSLCAELVKCPDTVFNTKLAYYTLTVLFSLKSSGFPIGGDLMGISNKPSVAVLADGREWLFAVQICPKPGEEEKTAEAALNLLQVKLRSSADSGGNRLEIGLATSDTSCSIVSWRAVVRRPGDQIEPVALTPESFT